MHSVSLTGGDEFARALLDLDRASDRGARAGVVRSGRELVKLTRAEMGGAPRWAHRGRSQRTGAAVTVDRSPDHVPRDGGPGDLTGSLRRNVHSVRPRRDLAGWAGKVSAMGGRHPAGLQNLYAPVVEAHYPFLRPALARFEIVAPALFEAAWAEQIGRVR